MKPSLDKAAKYFMDFDRKIFSGRIRKADINLTLSFNNSKELMGVFVGYYHGKMKCGEIRLSKRYCKDKEQFKSTLIHEMVHCIQFIKGKRVNHGAFFKRECRRIKRHFGIDIK